MPRQQQIRVTGLPQNEAQRAPRQVRTTQAATQADNMPSHIPQMRDADMDGFIKGLAAFQPSLEQYAQKEADAAGARATTDRMGGRDAQEPGEAYARAYFATDGLVRAQADGADLLARYNTEFDKDKGDLEGWLQENSLGRLKGVTDEHYIGGYQKGILPALAEVRKSHSAYQKQAVETRVESNAMQLLDNGMRAYTSQGMPVPDGYMEAIQTHMRENLGVSDQRFQELAFEAAKRIGDEGHFDVYDTLKKDRIDGSPGLYYDPKWKEKIDAAELHSFSAFATRSQQERTQRYNKSLYDVFAEEDPKMAQQKFKELKASGLFKGDAEGLIKWEKNLVEKLDGKPDVRQMENEGPLMLRAVQGKLSYEDVLNAESRRDITSSQRKELFTRIRQTQVENRQLAAAEGSASEKIYKSKDFSSALDYVEGVLKPRPQPLENFDKKELEFDHLQLAQARREFFTAAAGKQPGELQDLADSVAQRYIKRRQEADKGGMTPAQKEAATRAQVPYKTLVELRQALANQQVSPAEARRYQQYLMEQNGR
jgi:hypothetical protein